MREAGILNDNYRKALRGRKVVNGVASEDGLFGARRTRCLRRGVGGPVLVPLSYYDEHIRNLSCCGISEITFLSLDDDELNLNDKEFDELVAKYLQIILKHTKDNRVLITGLPVRKSVRQASMYNFEFYKRLLKTLESFGWKRITTNYVNNNSKNELAVLAVQKEEPDASLQTV